LSSPTNVIARLDRATQYAETSTMENEGPGVLDIPLEPVIGLAGGETRWRGMTVGKKWSAKPFEERNR
jgi:hypothetical protein